MKTLETTHGTVYQYLEASMDGRVVVTLVPDPDVPDMYWAGRHWYSKTEAADADYATPGKLEEKVDIIASKSQEHWGEINPDGTPKEG